MVINIVDCYDCPRRRGNHCHFYMCSTVLAKGSCTICVTCKNENWINPFYKECEGCITEYEVKEMWKKKN